MGRGIYENDVNTVLMYEILKRLKHLNKKMWEEVNTLVYIIKWMKSHGQCDLEIVAIERYCLGKIKFCGLLRVNGLVSKKHT